MIASNTRVVSASLALLALAAGFGQQPVQANGLNLDLSASLGGGMNSLMGGVLGSTGSITGMLPGVMNSATNMVTGLTTPIMGAMGPLTGGLSNNLNGMLSSTLGGMGTLAGGSNGLVGNTMRLATGAVNGVTSGLGNGLGGLASANGLSGLAAPTAPVAVSSLNGLANPAASAISSASAGLVTPNLMLRNNFKREAMAEGAMMGAANDMMAGANSAAMAGAAVESAAAANVAQGEANMMGAGNMGPMGGMGGLGGINNGGAMAAAAAGAVAGANAAQAIEQNALIGPNAANSLVGRQAIATEAIRNAQAESAAAGAEMVQSGANNARSASMASNAYRQAKLASARDRVNIAGTIQNSARISDAAIATHDAAIKAEDSLLGSELSVDSASTVFDSDGAYIPPVTASLLRSLPYGRIGLRNIVPKPLTHPSTMLPDVWLNGMPVNYQNIPLRMLPYGIGPAQTWNSLMASQIANANGAIWNGQPFISNNGVQLNGMVFDPAYAYLTGANMNGIIASSMLPILANGQLEAQDEVAMANLLNMQLQNGAGMLSTYQGYGRLNPVPMITGSVSDVTLMPTTTTGTTYPIGSALVIEPRDSYFQDYTDNASSRQNFDERQQ